LIVDLDSNEHPVSTEARDHRVFGDIRNGELLQPIMAEVDEIFGNRRSRESDTARNLEVQNRSNGIFSSNSLELPILYQFVPNWYLNPGLGRCTNSVQIGTRLV
jgi:hypothetical protein